MHSLTLATTAALTLLFTTTAGASPLDPLPPTVTIGEGPPAPPPPASASSSPSASASAPASPSAYSPPELTLPSIPDRATAAAKHGELPIEERLLHGFRIGYGYVVDFDKPVKSLDGKSLSERTNMRAPHNFLLGYEAFYRMVGHSWLNVILVGNVIVAGLEQSQFYPTANALLGFEFKNSFQIGVGANLSPLKGNIAHSIFAAGWTPRVGSFYTPIHAFFIPDVDGVHRMGVLTGVTW